MRKVTFLFILLIVLCCSFFHTAKSQEASVTPSTFGIQANPLGIWGHHEAKLSDKVALRSEIGLEGGFIGGSSVKTTYYLSPVLRLEPRWYYNLPARQQKGRRIDKNAGNFLTVQVNYFPNWFLITSNDRNISALGGFSLIPTWGIKRHLGRNFMYEVGAGLGYGYTPKSKNSHILPNIHLRIGYSF